jgi:hypothetical protein
MRQLRPNDVELRKRRSVLTEAQEGTRRQTPSGVRRVSMQQIDTLAESPEPVRLNSLLERLNARL